MSLIQDPSTEASIQAAGAGDAVEPDAAHCRGPSLRRQRAQAWRSGSPGPKGSTTVSRFAIADLEVAVAAGLTNSVPSSSSRSTKSAPSSSLHSGLAASGTDVGHSALLREAQSHVEKLLTERNGLQLEAARLRNEEARSAAERLGADRESLRAEVATLREALSAAGQQQATPAMSEALAASQAECHQLREQLLELQACHSALSPGRESNRTDEPQSHVEERETVDRTAKALKLVQEETSVETAKLATARTGSLAGDDSDLNSPRASWSESPFSSARQSAFTGSHSSATGIAQRTYPASIGEPWPSSAEAPSRLGERRRDSGHSHVTDLESCSNIDPLHNICGIIVTSVSGQTAEHRKGGPADEGAEPLGANTTQQTSAKEKAVGTPPRQQRKVSSTHIGTPPVAFLSRCLPAQLSPRSSGERLRSPSGALQSASRCSQKACGETRGEAACSDVFIRLGVSAVPLVSETMPEKDPCPYLPSSESHRKSTSTSPAPTQAHRHVDHHWVPLAAESLSESERRSQNVLCSPQRQRVIVVPPSATLLSQPTASHVLHHPGGSSTGTPGTSSVATSTPRMAKPPKSRSDGSPPFAAARSCPSLVVTPRMSPSGVARQMSPRFTTRRFQLSSQYAIQEVNRDETFEAVPTMSRWVPQRAPPQASSWMSTTSWQQDETGVELASPPAPQSQRCHLQELPYRDIVEAVKGWQGQADHRGRADQGSQEARAAQSLTPRDGLHTVECSSELRLSPQCRRPAWARRALHDRSGMWPVTAGKEEGIILPPPRPVQSCLARPPPMWINPHRKFSLSAGGASPGAPLGSPGFAAELLRNGSDGALTRSSLQTFRSP